MSARVTTLPVRDANPAYSVMPNTGSIAGGDPLEHQPAHHAQPGKVTRGVAAAGPREMLAGAEAVAAVPGAQRGRGDAQTPRDRGDGEPGGQGRGPLGGLRA